MYDAKDENIMDQTFNLFIECPTAIINTAILELKECKKNMQFLKDVLTTLRI